MKIALYKHTKYNTEIISEVTEYTETDSELIRISEPVEVEFPPRDQGEIIKSQVAQLDKVLDELMTQVYNIRAQKRELLAIPSMEQTTDKPL